LKENRLAVDAILDGTIGDAGYETFPVFNLRIPKSFKGADVKLLNPRNAWADKEAYDRILQELGAMFVENFKNFTDTPIGKSLLNAGPQLAVGAK
jgi:phosphoenolpyruvate carboxykinase (ATP)